MKISFTTPATRLAGRAAAVGRSSFSTVVEKYNRNAIPVFSSGALRRLVPERHDSDVAVLEVEMPLQIFANQIGSSSRRYKLLVRCSRTGVTLDDNHMIQQRIHHRRNRAVNRMAPNFLQLHCSIAAGSKKVRRIQPGPGPASILALTRLEVIGRRQLLQVIKTALLEETPEQEFVL